MKALILVDIQNDFCPGGKLAVSQGDEILPLVNELITSDKYNVIVATKDWHLSTHLSFAINNPGKKEYDMATLGNQPQVMWPSHCVQNSAGADFHPKLNTQKIDKIFTKGANKDVDSYSGFYDNDKISSTGLGEWLKEKGIKEVDIVGLALDYCVKATAEDANKLGFKTTVIKDATRAVNINPQDGEDAVKSLKAQGIEVK